MQRQWEHEVLTQFNCDGGNREQALNYQLFSWELCWQARSALRAAGRSISREVEERLARAAGFYLDLQVPEDPWDYGDSDGAFVTPLFCDERTAVAEWHQWFAAPERSPAINFWWRGERIALEPAALHGRSKPPCPITYTQSGHAMWRGGGWAVRVNASPLGYLQTAAHGHCDALHISVWRDGMAMIVDPGTGSYFHDEKLREWLASRPAHNGPCSMDGDGPQRLGPFLWAHPYLPPSLEVESERVTARVCLGRHIAERTLCPLADGDGFEIHDRCWASPGDGPALNHRPFTVLWQFGPGAKLEAIDDRSYRVTRRGMSLRVDVNRNWSAVCAVDENDRGLQSPAATAVAAEPLAGTVSSSFRHIERAPYLKLTAQPEEGGASVFCTIFRIIPPA